MGQTLVIQNDDAVNSLTDENSGAPYRYIRTSTTSGSLIRTIDGLGGDYLFPVGSYDSFGVNPAEDHYTPALFSTAILMAMLAELSVSGFHRVLVPLQ